MSSKVLATEVYSTINITPYEGPVYRFRWNGSKTVNVYILWSDTDIEEIDVRLYSERPTLEEVIADCEQYVADL